MKPLKTTGLFLLAVIEGTLAWQVLLRFGQAPQAVVSPLDIAALLVPAGFFVLALAVLRARPFDFLCRTLTIGIGAFLLLILALWVFDRFLIGSVDAISPFLFNLGAAILAPLPWLLWFAGKRRDGVSASAVALVYGALTSVGYRVQYGAEVDLLRWELAPAWGFSGGIVLWYLLTCLIDHPGLRGYFGKNVNGR